MEPSNYSVADSSFMPHDDLQEGIRFLLSKWNGLQMAIQNKWGGHDSLQKSHQLSLEILSWLTHHSKGGLNIEDLENLIYEYMLLSFNADFEDGSIEQVAEQLIILHEECFHKVR